MIFVNSMSDLAHPSGFRPEAHVFGRLGPEVQILSLRIENRADHRAAEPNPRAISASRSAGARRTLY
jgi:hypothetical protein